MEQYTDTELVSLSDTQIKSLFFEVRSILLQKNNLDKSLEKEIEIYLCYIAREIENRNL